MIVVTGASGHLGRAVVSHLASRAPRMPVVAAMRDPEKGRVGFGSQGIEIRACDFSAPEQLPSAFAGAEKVLIVSVNQLGEKALALHRAAISAARESRVPRVFYTSHMGARADSPFAPAPDHDATETFLAEGGRPFTALRHGFYAESALHLIGHGFENNEIVAPEDGPVSWTTRADLAEADALNLASEGNFDGRTPPLTASEAFMLDELAEIASELTGREVRRVTVPDKNYRERKIAEGVPEIMADMLLGAYQAARRGDFAATDPALGDLLGRKPRSMRDVLAEALKGSGSQPPDEKAKLRAAH